MSLLIPDAPTLFLNAHLIDGNGGKPVKNAGVLVEGTTITKVGKTSDFPKDAERQPAGDRPRGQDPHARADRGPLPHLVLGRPRAARPRPQAAGRAHDRLRRQERRARAALRLHRRRERGRPAPDRRDDPRHGQRGHHPRPAHGRLGAGHLRDLGDARLEPVVLEARHGRPLDLRRRCRRGSQGRPAEHQGRLRRHQALRHRRGPAAPEPASRGDDVLLRGDPGRRRGGAQAQPPDRGARARQRRRQALRRGRRRRDRARHLRRRRGRRDDRRQEGRDVRRPRARLPLGHPREGRRVRHPAGGDGGDRVPGGVGARLRRDDEAEGRRASASSPAATTASSGARTASTRRTSSSS